MSVQPGVYSLIKHLSEKNIRLWLEGESLKFKAPKGAMDAALKNDILQHKADLIAFLKNQDAGSDAIAPRPDLNSLPISNAQQRLWFIDQYSDRAQKAAYNIPVAMEMSGSLNVQALEAAINCLIRRHEVLQTFFVIDNGLPQQRKVDEPQLSLPIRDISAFSEEEKVLQCKEIIEDNLATVFELDKWPLFRPELIRLASGRHVFVATMHHIIADGWSMAIVIEEIARYYQQACDGHSLNMEPMPLQYADYAWWQLQQGETRQSQLAFWKEYLKDSSVLELPLDKKRQTDSEHSGQHISRQVDPELHQALERLAKAKGVTLFVVLVSAFQVLLSRFSRQQDISVGIPVANRTRPEWESMIGFFVNTLVLRSQVDGNSSFDQLLAQVRDNTYAIYSNQELPFDTVVEALVQQRDSSHSPLFQVMFSLQNTPMGQDFQLPGLDIKVLDHELPQARYEMTWNLSESEQGLLIDLEYRSDLFHENTMLAYLEYYVFFLQQIARDINANINDILLQPAQQTLDVQGGFNLSARPYPRESLLYPLFMQQVTQTPHAFALSGGIDGESWQRTYQQLADSCEQIARHLQACGVKAGDKVVLALPRGLEMIQSLLAVIKLGACYVPLDPDYPDERKQFIVRDAQAKLVLSARHLFKELEVLKQCGVELLPIEDLLATAATMPEAPTYQSTESSDVAACVFYTSGSTGRPKGVIVPHRAIVRLVCNNAFYTFTRDDVTAHISNVCFDAASMEIWGALLNGARMHVIEQQTLLSAPDFERVLEKQNVSVMFLSMGLFRVYAHEKPAMFSGLRALLIGGEAVDLVAARRVLDCEAPPLKLMNGYGPTENATFTACYDIESVTASMISMPLGRPISNTQVYIVDEQGQLLPPGIPGELCCAGDGLAIGYLNQAELTAEKFRRGYIKSLPDERVYLSGDLARFDVDGNIILHGRIDEQIKLRGFRIEPGEIENFLEQQEQVSSACVLLKQHPSGENCLVAYLVFDAVRENNAEEIKQLKEKVRNKLPVYMQPAYYHKIDSLPVNANGKVDKRKLPDPDWQQLEQEIYVNPSTILERELQSIWSDLLQLQQVSVEANFFELGGHSLLATRMVSRIQQHFSITINVKQVFSHPSIRLLAALLEEQSLQAGTQPAKIPEMLVHDHEGLHPLSKAQQRLWFIHQMNPESNAYSMPMAIRIDGELDIKRFENAVKALVQRHESLRTRFILDGSEVRQKVVSAVDAYDFVYKENVDEKTGQAAINHNEQRHFDLENGPLFYIELLHIAPDAYLLLMNMHHIVSDGWSMKILQQDLLALYQDEQALASLDIQYIDYVYWQQQLLDESEQKRLLDYWLTELEGVAEVLHVPSDRPRPEQQSFRGELLRHQLDDNLQKRALAFCQQENISSFVLGITCYALLLSKYSQQDDFCIGIPVAGREHHALENLIGFFVNGIAIRSDLRQRLTVRQLLEQFRDKTLSAFRHQQLSADVLIDAMGITPKAKYQPLAQVAFSHQRIDSNDMDVVSGLQVSMLSSQNHSAKYDLMFSLADDGKNLFLECEYASDIFDQSTIATLMQHYETLMAKMLSNSDAMVDSLDWYSHEDLLTQLKTNGRAYEKIYPMTLNQQAIYLDALINPDSKQNAIANLLDINMHIDLDLWQQAFSLIQQAHEVFRTDIVNIDLPGHHQVYQAIRQDAVQVDLHYEDWSAKKLDFAAASQKLESLAYCRYAIGEDALYHYSLYKLADDHYVAMLRAHHILFDGVSGKVFLDEICDVYQALHEGRKPVFVEERFEYFIQDQRAHSDSKDCLAFWQDKCSRLEALSFDSLLHKQDAGYQQKQLLIDQGQSLALRKFCRRQGLTPALFFKCLYTVLVQEYCRCDEDFYLLEYHHGRRSGEANSYGVYYQQNPFIVDHDLFSVEESLQEQLNNLFVYARQFQKESRHFRDISIQAQTQILPQSSIGFMYNYTQFESDIILLGQAQTSLFLSPRADGHVQLFVRERKQDFELLLLFGEHYFSYYHFLERMQALVTSVLAGDASLLLPLDWQQLNRLNHGFVKTPVSHEHLLQDFQEKTGRRDDTVAIYQQDAQSLLTFSYESLQRQSKALAEILVTQHDIGNDSRVAVYCENNPLFFVALFALIETGASYIPISVMLPCERVRDIIDNAQSTMLLTQENLLKNLEGLSIEKILLDHELPDGRSADFDRKHAQQNILPDDQHCLYTIFTSGSTGSPKGAMVSYQGEANLLAWYEKTLEINEQDCSLIISDLGFDLSQKNFFAFLRRGGSIVLSDNTLFDPEAIRALIARHKVTHINCAPSAFYALLEGGESSWQALQSLRWVVLGGEAIVLDHLRDWYQSAWCKAQLMNSYGPTECTDVVCAYILQAEDFEKDSAITCVPLGQAIDNAELYVLNEDHRITAAGLVGEIAIGGTCLGLGYIGQARLNQEKFIAMETPRGNVPVYLSGDLGRINDKGQLEYLGRRDFQVKLRGQRIELEEIAHALRQIPVVQDALVSLHNEALVAYVIGKEDIDGQVLKTELAKTLPAYMLPQAFVRLEKWPLNKNGKIDRKALPEPDVERNKPFLAPRNATEEALAEIWCEVLAVSRVSVNDSFFELGGHSLLATKAVARLKEHFKVEFPLKALFDLHTIAEIGEYIDGLKWALESQEKQDTQGSDERREEGFL